MIKSFLRLLAVPKGFNPDGVLTLTLTPGLAGYPHESPQRDSYYREVLSRVRTLPGIESAGLASKIPLEGGLMIAQLQIEGRQLFEQGKGPVVDINLISPEYLQTMGIEARSGRPFSAQDGAEAPKVAIVNETIARRFFPDENPLGHRLLISRIPRTIVGVAPGQNNPAGMASLANAVRRQAQTIEPNEPVNPVVALEDRLSKSRAVA